MQGDLDPEASWILTASMRASSSPFSALLCIRRLASLAITRGSLALWLPVRCSQWEAAEGGWKAGGERGRSTYAPAPSVLGHHRQWPSSQSKAPAPGGLSYSCNSLQLLNSSLLYIFRPRASGASRYFQAQEASPALEVILAPPPAKPDGTPAIVRSPQFIGEDSETQRGQGSCVSRAVTTTCHPSKDMLLKAVTSLSLLPLWGRLSLSAQAAITKMSQTGWPVNNRNVFLTVLGVRSPRSRCQQIWCQ